MNYNDLEYNLYTIVNCDPTENEKNIKKKIIKLLKFFHPDKTSKLEDKIYNHIILANEILLDINKRKEYDFFLSEQHKDYYDLIQSFNNEIMNDYNTITADQALVNFNKKTEELNNFHNYTNNNENILINNELINNLIKSREIISDNIKKIDVIDTNDFNKQFDEIKNKINNKSNNNEIIPINSSTNDNLLLVNFNKLYIESNIENNNGYYL